jgi:hypothetical protein
LRTPRHAVRSPSATFVPVNIVVSVLIFWLKIDYFNILTLRYGTVIYHEMT